MREIEFRAWDTELKEYIDDYFELDFLHSKYCTKKAFYFYPQYILQQYTGLKDKNGTRIFEGDIVKYRRIGTQEYLTSKVTFSDAAFYADYRLSDLMPISIHETEVIGNVFENKDLLNGRT